MRRKGQFISLVSVMTMMLIVTGNMFTAVVANEEISETLTYSTDHVNRLMEAKTRNNIYHKNMEEELRFTANNVAYLIGPQAGNTGNKGRWKQNTIPDIDEIKNTYKNELFSGDYNINDENRMKGCSHPAEIPRDNLTITGSHSMEIDLTGGEISCAGDHTEATIPIRQKYKSKNPRNNYIPLAKYSIKLAEKTKKIIPDQPSATGSSSVDCTDQPIAEEAIKDEAESEAKENFENNDNYPYNLTALDKTSDKRPESVAVLHSEIDIIEDDYDITSSNSESCDLDGDGVEESSSYNATAEYNLEKVQVYYNLIDGKDENRIATDNGTKKQRFEFSYVESFE